METEDYLALFYPFDKLDVVKKGVESNWNVSGDRTMIALTMTFMEEPMAKNMSFQREYAEPERDRHHVPGLCGTAGPPWKCDVFAEKEFEKFRVLQDRSYQSDFDRLRGLFQ